MHKLRKYYQDNKEKIWKVILIVALIIAILQVLNYITKKKNENLLNTSKNNADNNILNNSTFVSNTSSVTGKTISDTEIKKAENIINEFVNYCNEKELEKAYNLLSNKCKEKLYSTLEEFTNNYYSNIFKTEKIITIENWHGDTYKVRYIDDLLSKGENNLGEEKQDYITIVYENEEEKININSYIENTKINKSNDSNNILVSVISKDIFMDYEIYDIEITNNSPNTIMLDPLTSTKTIFLKDNNDIKYVSYSHELRESDLKIKSGVTRKIQIKFTNSYSSSTDIKSLNFTKVILDYKESGENIEKFYEIIVNL